MSAGTIAQMIPPSILMAIYGIITEQSIGKLLIADSEMKDIIAGIWPFFGIMLINLAIYIIFPQTVLFLPGRMMGK
ncbi:TRAP transporter large permease subunit [Chloroflexota bacterium]